MKAPAHFDIRSLFAGPRLDQQRRAIRIGAVLLPDEILESMLREELDSAARNSALEMIKLRGPRGRQLALRLLNDRDPDIVLQAVLALDVVQNESDLTALTRAAEHSNPNIAQAAIVAIGHSRNPAAHNIVVSFTARDPWLQAAAIEALGALRDPRGIPILRALALDSIVGPLAVDAIARIGGQDALDVLSAAWISTPRESIESADLLEAIVSVAEEADRLLFAAPRFREEFARRIGESDRRERELLVRARIALGRHEITPYTVEQFLVACGASSRDLPLPATLRHHPELTPALMAGAPRWALALAAKYADRINPDVLHRLLLKFLEGELPECDIPMLVTALQSRDALPRGTAAALVSALSDCPAAPTIFRGLVPHFANELAVALQPFASIPMPEHVLVAAALPRASWTLAEEIDRLAPEQHAAVLLDLMVWPEAVVALPWERWLDQTPALLSVAARLSRCASLPKLIHRFREALRQEPASEIIDAVIHSGDTLGEAILVELASSSRSEILLDALGRCRGDASLTLLRGVAASATTSLRPIALRALARRAATRDIPLFLAAAEDNDWLVRHACVRALSRFSSNPDVVEALVRLASDSAQLVSDCAIGILEARR